MRIGLFLSRKQRPPDQLLIRAGFAADPLHGFWLSDHYHPWLDARRQRPFVLSMIGAVSEVCDLPVITAVTDPTNSRAPMPGITPESSPTQCVREKRAGAKSRAF